jgi:hypothetical protein
LDDYRDWVIWYWILYEGMDPDAAADQWDELIEYAGKEGVTSDDVFREYNVLFVTSGDWPGIDAWVMETLKGACDEGITCALAIGRAVQASLTESAEGQYADNVNAALSGNRWDVVLAYSLGGSVVGWTLKNGADWTSDALIFIEPAFNWLGPMDLNASDYPGMRIITLNAKGKVTIGPFGILGAEVGGTVSNAMNFNGSCPGNHCTMHQFAPMALFLTFLFPSGPTPVLDQYLAGSLGGCVPGKFSESGCY